MGNFIDWFERNYKGVIVVLVAIMAATMVVLAYQQVALSGPAAGATTRPIPTFTSKPSATPQRQPAEAMQLLAQTDRAFTISVIGDSTGAIEDNWVGQLAQWMSDKYDRPVEFHQWSVRVEPNAYQPAQTIGSGDNAPIVIWNGSAEGKNISYSLDNWADLVPVEPSSIDLAFINHGHNVGAGQLVTAGNTLLKKMTSTMQSASIVVIGQNPQAETGGTLGADQATNVRAWMRSAQNQGYATVDVLDVFLQQGDYSTLLLGAVHPNADGFALWVKAVEQRLTS